MAATTSRSRPAASVPRTSLVVLRAVVSAHVVAIAGQPVFAGVLLNGDFDGLRWHSVGADVVTAIGYLQVVVAAVLWVRLRQAWPFVATSAVAVAETVQYAAGMHGQLWLHIPLGVMTIVALVMLFVSIWRRPLRQMPERRAADDV